MCCKYLLQFFIVIFHLLMYLDWQKFLFLMRTNLSILSIKDGAVFYLSIFQLRVHENSILQYILEFYWFAFHVEI